MLDLSGGRVALDLIAFARASGVEPLVSMLPGDPVRLNPVAAGSAARRRHEVRCGYSPLTSTQRCMTARSTITWR